MDKYGLKQVKEILLNQNITLLKIEEILEEEINKSNNKAITSFKNLEILEYKMNHVILMIILKMIEEKQLNCLKIVAIGIE